jgi:hypothetical protein
MFVHVSAAGECGVCRNKTKKGETWSKEEKKESRACEMKARKMTCSYRV